MGDIMAYQHAQMRLMKAAIAYDKAPESSLYEMTAVVKELKEAATAYAEQWRLVKE